MCRSSARTRLPAVAVMVLLLLLCGALAQSEVAPTATNTGDAAAGSYAVAGNTTDATASTDKPVGVAEELLQRLAQDLQQTRPGSSSRASSTDSSSDTETTTAELPDFSSTANALAQQAVREGGAKAAALALQQAAIDAHTDSNSTAKSSSSTDAAALQLLELQQQTGNSSSPDNTDGEVAGLQLLLQTIRQQWQASGNRQRQQQQSGSGTQSTAAGGECHRAVAVRAG